MTSLTLFLQLLREILITKANKLKKFFSDEPENLTEIPPLDHKNFFRWVEVI